MEDEIDIKDLFLVLWRKKVIIIIVTIICILLSVFLYSGNKNVKNRIFNIDSKAEDEIVSSFIQTNFIFARGTNKELDGIKSTYKLNVDDGVITNLNEFATSTLFLNKILEKNDFSNVISAEDLKNNINIVKNGSSDIITLIVSIRKINKEDALDISNKILDEITNKINILYEINEIIVIDGPKEVDVIENESEISEANSKNDLQIINEQNLSLKKKIVLFAIIGFVLSSGVLIIIELFSNSVKSQIQLESVTKQRTLVKIPKSKLDMIDLFKLVRVYLNDENIILVTSPEKKDGKSYVSSNLARAFANSGKKTLLINTDYLISEKIEKNIKESEISNLSSLLKYDNSNSVDSITEEKLIEKIKELEKAFDVIIIDSSNILESANTLTIAKIVKNTIIVCSERKTKLQNIVMAKNNIEEVGGIILGNVLNNSTEKN